jgi:hypothetical protein
VAHWLTRLIGRPNTVLQELYNTQSSFGKIRFFTSSNTAEMKSGVINGWKEKGIEVIVGDVNSEEDVKKAYEGTIFTLFQRM